MLSPAEVDSTEGGVGCAGVAVGEVGNAGVAVGVSVGGAHVTTGHVTGGQVQTGQDPSSVEGCSVVGSHGSVLPNVVELSQVEELSHGSVLPNVVELSQVEELSQVLGCSVVVLTIGRGQEPAMSGIPSKHRS